MSFDLTTATSGGAATNYAYDPAGDLTKTTRPAVGDVIVPTAAGDWARRNTVDEPGYGACRALLDLVDTATRDVLTAAGVLCLNRSRPGCRFIDAEGVDL